MRDAEFWKGISDVPLAIEALIFGILLWQKPDWAALLILIAAAALMGTAAHIFTIPEPYISLLWTMLYVVLFELVRRFSLLLSVLLTGESRKETLWVWILEGALWLSAVILRFRGNSADIFCLVAFGAILLFAALFLKRNGSPSVFLRLLLACAVLALIFQGGKHFIPGGVVLGHVMLAAALVFFYLLGRAEP